MSIDFSRETASGLTAVREHRPSDTEHGRLGDVLAHELKWRRHLELIQGRKGQQKASLSKKSWFLFASPVCHLQCFC